MTTIAFIGLGHMGGGMAANLAKAGHDVRAFDLSADALDRAKAAGCLPAATAGEAIADAEVVVTMLPAGTHVAQVYAEDILQAAKPGTLLIDSSTIDVATARAVAASAEAKGLVAVDAPVSGGIAAAESGTLTFMVGGSSEAFERARPFLDAMGTAVIHAGATGTGQAAKICNNMILGATMAVTTEAFNLAKALGLDAERFYAIASVSSGQSWSMTRYCPVAGIGPESPADRGFEGGFASALMLKDMDLALGAARDASLDVPVATRAAERYRTMVDAGDGNRDFSAVIELDAKG
jgi:3-hydroxyisobutyrate dehydrogenase